MSESKLTQEELATNAVTWEHIYLVMKLLGSAQVELMRRQFTHDQSKLYPPEVSTFTEFTPKLATSTYGSEEYKSFLKKMKPALDHHYTHNRHHPEYFKQTLESPVSSKLQRCIDTLEITLTKELEDPEFSLDIQYVINVLKAQKNHELAQVNNMNLFDLLEMFIDWCAACKRHNDGDINKSIDINTSRFSLSPQLVNIFKNTIDWVNDDFETLKTQKDL